MATLALSVAGQFVGGLVGGPIGATIGRALGAVAGSAVDGMLFGEKPREAPLFDVRLGGSSEGAAIPRLYGWGRLSGNIIWACELLQHESQSAGAKGFGPPAEAEEEILASFAIGLCEGPVARMGRIWADGQLLDTRGLNLRFYAGNEEQEPDSLIEAVQSVGNAPAYRGLCYLVFENLPLSRFGNRIPNLSVELCRVVGELEPGVRAITVIPGATEFGYDPAARVRVLGEGEGVSENSHLMPGVSNWSWSIDELMALCPNLEHVALVVTWFGDDLRCGSCRLTPRVEAYGREIEGASWSVAGYARSDVPVVSHHNGGPAYGGTPSDASVLAAITDLKARGVSVTLYPLMMMDVPAGNGLPDPYGGAEQASYPWRGRVTCHPAAGETWSPDGTSAAATQVAAFLPDYREMVLHYAGIAASAGVDALLIGSEMRGLTTVRGEGNSFPFVEALVELASDVRAVVGPDIKLSYAADWSEYSGLQGGGEKFVHLDPLWASDDIDAVGIDCYMPLSDWREGESHLDALTGAREYDLDYLAGNVAGGEGFDWYYAGDADRRAQVRSPISDGAHGEAWIWRYKDLSAFWTEEHFDRPGGARSETPTAWVPGSKPIWLTELGCGAVDRGANQPNIFGDDKSGEGGRPYFSSGMPDGLIQRQFLRAHQRYWGDAANLPTGMIDPARIYLWTWDARPYPSFPALEEVWADGPNHKTGHWLTGRMGAVAGDELIAAIAAEHGVEINAHAGSPLIGGLVINGPGTAREAIEPILALTGLKLVARDGVLETAAGTGTGVMLDADELAADDGPILSRRRGDVAEKPGRLGLVHYERERDYQTATATALRPGAGPLVTETLPLVLDGAGARRGAERLLDQRAGAGDRLEFALPPNAIGFEPGDRVSLPELAEGPFEIVEIRDGAVRRVVAEAVGRGDAVATGVDRPRGGAGVPQAEVTPVMVVAHLPPLPEDVSRSRLVVGAYAKPWPGSVRITDAATGAALGEVSRPAHIGRLVSVLAAGPDAVWDRGVLEIALSSGHLADGEELAVLGGANRIAVEMERGWEVIGFAEAELIALKTYRLTRLLRGLEGTLPGAAEEGARVMVLGSGTSVLGLEAHHLGESRALKVYAGSADTSGLDLLIEPGLEPALPLAPVHVRARLLDDGDIRLSWVRRSRADGDGWGVVEPALEHVPEAWRVSILDGGDVVRTFDTSGPQATYSSAEQAADFGGPAPDFAFTIAQVSAVLGEGHAAQGVFHV